MKIKQTSCSYLVTLEEDEAARVKKMTPDFETVLEEVAQDAKMRDVWMDDPYDPYAFGFTIDTMETTFEEALTVIIARLFPMPMTA